MVWSRSHHLRHLYEEDYLDCPTLIVQLQCWYHVRPSWCDKWRTDDPFSISIWLLTTTLVMLFSHPLKQIHGKDRHEISLESVKLARNQATFSNIFRGSWRVCLWLWHPSRLWAPLKLRYPLSPFKCRAAYAPALRSKVTRWPTVATAVHERPSWRKVATPRSPGTVEIVRGRLPLAISQFNRPVTDSRELLCK